MTTVAGVPHGEAHQHLHDLREVSRRRLAVALALTVAIIAVEIIGALVSGSLALFADAGHAFTDSAAIGIALLANWVARKPASIRRTFGFERAEVLAAAFNAVALWVVAAWIGWEAVQRFIDGARGDPVEIEAGWVLAVGGIALAANVVAAMLLRPASGRSLNMEAAFRHVLADLLVSVAVIVSAAVILATGWWWVDPALSVLIAVVVVISSWKLAASVFEVLIDGVPRNIDMDSLCSDMEGVTGVTVMHDIHVRMVTSGYVLMSAHVVTDRERGADAERVLSELRTIAKDRHGISHLTLQLEPSDEDCTEDHHLDRPQHVASSD